MIGRRQLVGGLAALACAPKSRLALAQPSLPVVGFLGPGPATGFEEMVAGFHEGLKEGGYVEGQNVAIDYRWGDGEYDRLSGLAGELVRRRVAVLVAAGGLVTARAAQRTTSTVPVVFASGGDPVASGLVASMARPGGNLTGVFLLSSSLAAKRLEVLSELLPAARTITLLVNPANPNVSTERLEIESAARARGLALEMVAAASEADFDQAFAGIAARPARAVMVGTDGYFNTQRQALAERAARHAVPTIYTWGAFARSGGLIAHGSDRREEYRHVGLLTSRILSGAKAADLPVQQAAKVELVINLKAAKALGLAVPSALLLRADEVIE